MVGLSVMSLMTGCRNVVPDGSQIVISVGDEKASLATLQTMIRYQQAVSYDYYMQMAQAFGQDMSGKRADFWEPVLSEDAKQTELENQKKSGVLMPDMNVKSYGDQMIVNTAASLAGYMAVAEQADEYDVSLSKEETTHIKDTAKTFMKNSDKEVLENNDITEQSVVDYLTYYTLQDKVYGVYAAQSEITVSEEEAKSMTISYLSFYVDESNPDCNTEEKVKKQAEDYLKSLNGVDFTQLDFKMAAAEYGNAQGGTESIALNDKEEAYAFTKEEVDTIASLNAGALYGEVVKGKNQNYYVIRMDRPYDEEASAKYQAELRKSRVDTAFAKDLAKWMKNEKTTYDIDVLQQIDVNDNVIYTGIKAEDTQKDEVSQDIMAGEDIASEQESNQTEQQTEKSSEKSEEKEADTNK